MSIAARRLVRAISAARYARLRTIDGLAFDRFGRLMGCRLLLRGLRLGWAYVLNPVSLPRYFEFDFASKHFPEHARRCLDVSSPRLFSVYQAAHRPGSKIVMMNPDRDDASQSSLVTNALKLASTEVRTCDLRAMAESGDRFSCIWAISVVEHISGAYDDRDAVRMMDAMLEPGGRLILTVPVDRQPWDEYRAQDHYNLQPSSRDGRYFFQRFYDEAAIAERLLGPLGRPATATAWWGERVPGVFSAYTERWLREGIDCTLADPREFADHYQCFSSWREMPGMGVCALVVDKR